MSGELRLSDEAGLSGFAAYGRGEESDDQTGRERTFITHIYKIGSSIAWYPFGGFQGMRLGLEGSYTTASDIERVAGEDTLGLGLLLLIGYKPISASGFTFLADFGAGYRIPVLNTARQDRAGFQFLFRLGLGWSF